MSIEEALELIRTTGPDVWGRMTSEMKSTSKRRNIEAVKTLRIGERVLFACMGETFEGYVRRVTASGRAILEIEPSGEVPGGLISVPAGYLKHIA